MSDALWDRVLPEVAEVYLAAVREGKPPTKAVETHFHLARSTAIRWVQRTRQRRLLPPAGRGRTAAGLHTVTTVRAKLCVVCGQLWPCDSAGKEIG